jgi:hypothetical protein
MSSNDHDRMFQIPSIIIAPLCILLLNGRSSPTHKGVLFQTGRLGTDEVQARQYNYYKDCINDVGLSGCSIISQRSSRGLITERCQREVPLSTMYLPVGKKMMILDLVLRLGPVK